MWADIEKNNQDDYYGKVYLIYMFVLLFVSLLMFYFYLKQTQMKQMFYQARILFYFVLFNFILLIILLIPFFSSGYKHFIFNETCKNGNDYLPTNIGWAKNEGLWCYDTTLSPSDNTPIT
jgi:membrane-associated protease RseP (regulator of RpoE activity)